MKKKLNNKGITLLEIVISIAILSSIIVPLYSMFITSQKISNKSDEEFESITIAQKYMEKIKASDNFDWIIKNYSGGTINQSLEDKGYEINIHIEPEDKFKNPNITDYNKSIKYDVLIEVNEKDNDTEVFCNGSKATVAGMNLDIVYNNDIKITQANISIPIFNTSGANIRVDLISSTSDSSIKENLRNRINFNVTNKENKPLTFYFVKEKDSDINYNFNVIDGTVKKYTNIFFGNDSNKDTLSLDYNLYKVIVKVSKSNELITKIEGCKALYR